jgi:hypothetical protein
VNKYAQRIFHNTNSILGDCHSILGDSNALDIVLWKNALRAFFHNTISSKRAPQA